MFLGFYCEDGFLLASPVLLGFCCDVGFYFLFFIFYFFMRFCSCGILVGSGGVVGMVEEQWW